MLHDKFEIWFHFFLFCYAYSCYLSIVLQNIRILLLGLWFSLLFGSWSCCCCYSCWNSFNDHFSSSAWMNSLRTWRLSSCIPNKPVTVDLKSALTKQLFNVLSSDVKNLIQCIIFFSFHIFIVSLDNLIHIYLYDLSWYIWKI